MNQKMSNAIKQGDQTPVILNGVGTLEVKEVECFGTKILSIKLDEKVYAGVSYICKGIGLNKSQKDTQVQNIQSDLVLNKGCLKFQAGVIDKNNDVLAIDIDYLPLWLAKISITPKMKKQQPEVVDKLVEYQLKAKDVLANAFLHNKPMSAHEELRLHYRALEEQEQEIHVIDNRVKKLENTMTIDYSQQLEIEAHVSKHVIEVLNGKDSPAYRNKTVRGKAFSYLYRELKRVFQVNSYRNIAVKNYENALEVIDRWQPDNELKLMIRGANTQLVIEG